MTDLSPGAQFTRDLLTAVQRANRAGLSAERMAGIIGDVADDLADLADDSQWPDKPPATIEEAREQLDRMEQ